MIFFSGKILEVTFRDKILTVISDFRRKEFIQCLLGTAYPLIITKNVTIREHSRVLYCF
mgnify:CR=1 FL=1